MLFSMQYKGCVNSVSENSIFRKGKTCYPAAGTVT